MPLSTALIILGALSTSSMAQNLICTQELMDCPDGSKVGKNSSNGCEFDPCLLIAVGLPCDAPTGDAPTGDAANPCAQDFKCNGLNPTTGCECRAKYGGESVCTVIPYECTDGGNVEVCKADQICSEPDRKGMCEIVIGGECNRDTGPGCGPNHRCDEGECAREHTVGESCGGLNQFRHLCAEGLECTVPPQFEGLEDLGGICTVITIAVPGCQLDAFICPDGSTVGQNLSNGCEFDPCPLIDVGLACDAPTGGAVDPCAQGRQCNQGNENAVCECHAKEAGGDSVCTESLFCTSAIVKCLADDSEATRNHLNGCKADCPLIDGGDACNNDNSCAQGVECNQGDENAVCECKVTEAGYGSVCTVTNSDTIGKPGCKRRLRDNKQN